MKYFFLHFNWVKALKLLVALSLSAGVVGSYTLDLWAKRRLTYFESAFSEALKRPVTIRRTGFDPRSGFYFEDFSLKERTTAPRPLSIERLEAHARILLWPEPTVRVHKLVLYKANIGVDVHPQDLFRSQLWLKRVPYLETKIGRLKFEAKLDAVEAYDGRISIFSPAARQDFESVRFFAGKRWHTPQALFFEGRVAGKPLARFKIDCRIRAGVSGELESEARVDFKHFTTAYLAPFLSGRFHLPDRNLTGSLKVSIDRNSVVSVLGFLALPQMKSRSWALWEKKPFEARLKLKGRREVDQIIFDDFTLRSSGITVFGNGSMVWKKGRESWRASLAAKNVPAQKIPEAWTRPWRLDAGTIDFSMKVAGDAKRYSPDTLVTLTNVGIRNRASNLSIDRATGTLRVLRDRVEMRDLWLFYNQVPLRLSGLFVFGESGRLALEAQTYPGQLAHLKENNPINAAFRLAAKKKAGAWSGALRLHLEAAAKHTSTWTLSLRGWQFRRPQHGPMEAVVRHVLVRSDGSPAAPIRGPFRIDGMRVSVDVSPTHARIFLKEGQFENGKIAGLFSWKKFAGWKTRFRLRGVQTSGLARKIGFKHPITGTLDAAGSGYGTEEQSAWAGHFRIRDGRIGPSVPLKNLAEQTGIDSLHPIQFDRLFGRLRSDENSLAMERWKLEGADVRFEADAKIRDGAMSGRLTAHFPMRVVRSSSGLGWLAHFVGEHDGLDFDFRVAGRLEKPRVHWMAGAFRDKIEKRLAPWMRAEFTKQIHRRFAEQPPAIAA